MQALVTSFPFADVALALARILVGTFFILARFRWVYDPMYQKPWFNPTRQQSLVNKLNHCGFQNATFWAPFVAYGELLAAIGLIVGLLTPLAALGLLVILVYATKCTAMEKTMKQNPIDKIDVVSCYLWNPEPIYIALVVMLMAFGAGAYSLDHVLVNHGFGAMMEVVGIVTFIVVIFGSVLANWFFPSKYPTWPE